MSALIDRIAEVLRDELERHGLDDMGFDDQHVAERVAEALQLAEDRHWVSNRRGVLHHAIVGWTAVEEKST